jgi:hypothetical protein
MTRRWLERGDPMLASTFGCAAELGDMGPGAEMPLLGLKWSLDERVADGTNAGFLRKDALLAVVILTDQDDCSRLDDNFIIDGSKSTCFDPADPNIIPLGDYLAFLDGLKGGRDRWAAAVLGGPPPDDCTSAFGFAAPAVRLKDFVTQAGGHSTFGSICSGDLAQPLKDALDAFDKACRELPPIQ